MFTLCLVYDLLYKNEIRCVAVIIEQNQRGKNEKEKKK